MSVKQNADAVASEGGDVDPEQKRDDVLVGSYLVSPEAYRMCAFMLIGVMFLVCIILSVAFADIPENTELIQSFGYNNVCVYLDYPPASNVAPTLWIFFLVPWTIYSISWIARVWSRVTPRGPVSECTYRLLQAVTGMELIFGAHFVQVFANKPHELEHPLGLKLHSYPYMLLIISLWTMSFKTVWWFVNHEGHWSFAIKAAAYFFELVYFTSTLLKVLVMINLLTDDSLWVANERVAFT